MITFGGPQCIVDKSIKKIIAEVRPLFCWRCQHFGNKRSSNPSLRVLRIRKGKFLVKNCSLAHIASVHNCLLCCQHLFEFLGFPRLGSLGFPPLSGLPGLPGLPTPSISAGLTPPWRLASMGPSGPGDTVAEPALVEKQIRIGTEGGLGLRNGLRLLGSL